MSPEERRRFIQPQTYLPARLRFREIVEDLRRRNELLKEKSTIVRKIDFSDKAFRALIEDPAFTTVPIAPIIKEHLTLIGEEWPGGSGFIGGFYDKESHELKHLFLGRVIDSNAGETLIFGVRYSPHISDTLFFQVQTPENSPLLERLPQDHRKSMQLVSSGNVLLDFAQTVVIPNKI
ncbi:MAG: hypothetical protein AAB583_05920 [Patescibacteria group bacterium]